MPELVNILPNAAAIASRKLVNCQGCTACCERGGLVYVRDCEVSELVALGVPLIRLEGVAFIKRLPDGSCPMLLRSERKCSIYEHRPLCCRLFPLDVLSMEGKLRWAISSECPTSRKYFGGGQGPGSLFGFATVARLAGALNGLLDAEVVTFWAKKEHTAARIELLPVEESTTWTSLLECAQSSGAGIQASGKKGETKKERLKRMLKEKKKRKKDKKK